MGKIKVTKDSEVLEIEPSDLKSAINDGYRQVQTIPVTNGKEVLYIDDTDLENAIKDGYVKKKDDSNVTAKPSGSGLSTTQTPNVNLFGVNNAKQETVLTPDFKPVPAKSEGFKNADFASRRLVKGTPAYKEKVKEIQSESVLVPKLEPSLNEAEDLLHTKLGGKISDPTTSKTVEQEIISERKNPAVQYELGESYLNKMGLKEGEDVINFYHNKKSELEAEKEKVQNEYDAFYSNTVGSRGSLVGKENADILKNYENTLEGLNQKIKTFDKFSGVVNAKKTIDNTPLPDDDKDVPNYFQTIGAKVNSLSNPDALKTHEEDMANNAWGAFGEIKDIRNYDNEMTGIITKQNDLVRQVRSNEISKEDYEAQSKQLEEYANIALDRHVGAKMKVYGKALGQIIDKKRESNSSLSNAWNNIFSATPSKEEAKKAIDELKKNGATFTPKEEQFFLDNPNQIQGTAILPTYVFKTADGFSKMINPIGRLLGETETVQRGSQEVFDRTIATNPNKSFEQPETIIDVNKGDTFLKDIENPKAGELNWGYGTGQGVANAMATVTNFIVANKGFGALAKASGLGENATLIASNVASNTALTYDDAIKTAETFTKNKNEQKAYALITGVLGGLLFAKLDPEGIVKKAFTNPSKETVQSFLSAIPKEGIKAMSKEKVGEFILNTAKKAIANNVSASTILTANEIKDVVVESLFNPKTASKHDFDIQKTLAHNAITFGALSLLHGIGGARSDVAKRDAIRQSAFEASKDIPSFERDLKLAVDNKKITEAEANEKLRLVNDIAEIRNSKDIPANLSLKNQARYAVNLLNEKQIQSDIEGITDKVQIDRAKEEINQLQEERKSLIENPSEPIEIPEAPKVKGEPERISQPIELSVEEKPSTVSGSALSVKERNKIIQNHLLDNEGDIDGAFKKAGYVSVNGIWIAPEAVEYAKKVSPEVWKHLKDNGIKYLEGGDDGRGLQKTISYDGKNIRGIGVNENVGENHSGHNHTMLHELAHHVWQEELTPEQRKIFQDDNPISDYAKSVKEGKEKTLAKHDEEDFAELYAKNNGSIEKAIAEKKGLSGSALKDVVPVFHHTKVDVKDFDFGNFQRGKNQVSQFGDGLAVSTDTTPFLQKRYGNPIKGEVKDSDFVVIDTNKTEKEIYEELKSKGYKFNKPDGGSYIGNDPAKEYDGTEKANEQPAIISLFNDFQKSNPEVKGVKIVNHIIANEKVSPFYVIYDNKSFYGEGSLKAPPQYTEAATSPQVDEKVVKSMVKRIAKSLNVDEQRSQQIHDIALKAKDYEDFKKKVADLIGDDTVNENRIAEQYDEVREEAKSEYEKELERNLEDLRAAYTDATKADAALKKMNESPKSVRGFIKRLLTGATPESVAANKARLVEMQRQYRKEKADMRAMLPRERGANFVVEKLSRAARNGDISQEAADLAIDLIRKQPDMFGDLAISITGKKGENDGVQGWYRAADALVKIFKNPSDETTVAHEVLHHTERFLPHEIRDKIIAEWNNEVNLQIADIQKKLKTETNTDKRQQLTQGLLYLGLAQERQIEPNSANVQSMERIMSKYLGDHTDSQGNFHKGLGNSWYQLYNPSEWWAVNASRLFREAKNKPELKTWTDKAKAFYNYLIESVKRIFKGSPTAAVEKGLKAVLNGDVLEDREGTQLSASKKLLNIKQKGSFEDKLKSIYEEVNKSKSTEAATPKEQIQNEKENIQEPIQEGDEGVTGINEPITPKETEPTKADVGEVKPPPSEPKEVEVLVGDNGDKVSITHAAMDKLAEELGLPDRYEKDPTTISELDAAASKRIAKGEMAALIKKLENKDQPTAVEQRMMLQYVAGLKAEYDATKSDKVLQEFRKVKKLSDIVGGRDVALSLRARQGDMKSKTLENGVLSAMDAKMEALNTDTLTDTQKAEVEKQVKDYKEKAEKETALRIEAEKKFSEMEAENELLRQKKLGTPKSNIIIKDGKRDFKAERQSLKDKLKQQVEDYKAAGNKMGIASDGGAESFVITTKMAKTIGEIATNHVAEVGVKIKEVVDKTLEDVKEYFGDSITERDIMDILAGKYNERKQTKNELAAQMREIKKEAILLQQYESILNREPKSEKEKIVKNQRLKDLRDKITELEKEQKVGQYSEIELAKRAIQRNKAAEVKIREKIAKKEYISKPRPKNFMESPEFKQKHPKLYKDFLDSQIKKEEAQLQFDTDLVADEMKRAGLAEKWRDIWRKGTGTVKHFFASFDFSGLGVQNLPMIVTNPVIGAKGIKESAFDFASQGRHDRFLAELHNSPDWDMIKEVIRISEPKSLSEKNKEQLFPDRFRAVVKIKGKTYGEVKIGKGKYELFDISKPFERQFVSLGNALRVIKLRTEAEKLYEKGFTWEKNPEEFISLGRRINNLTSSADVPEAYKNDLTNTFVWSTKLIAAKLNMLGISDIAAFIPKSGVKKGYYKSLGIKGQKLSRQQLYAIGDLAKFASAVMATTYLSAMIGGGKVNTDPTDDKFLDVTFEDGVSKNYTGGFSKYIALVVQLIRQGKSSNGRFTPYSGLKDRVQQVTHFIAGKQPPITRAVVSAVAGEDYTGKKTDLGAEAAKLKYPMAAGQIAEQIKRDGMQGLFEQGIETLIGINVKDERDYPFKSEIKNYKEGGREITKEENKDFETKRDAEVKRKIDLLKQTAAYKDLPTDEDKKEAEASMKASITESLKKEMFGEKKMSRKEKRIQRRLKEAKNKISKQ